MCWTSLSASVSKHQATDMSALVSLSALCEYLAYAQTGNHAGAADNRSTPHPQATLTASRAAPDRGGGGRRRRS